MKNVSRYLLVPPILLLAAGCTKVAKFDGPTVDAFHGQLLSEGKPVSISDGEVVKIFLVHRGSGERFRIPIKPDGSFDIGWMPIGTFNCILERKQSAPGSQGLAFQTKSNAVPGGLQIEEGKTEYEIEVGEKF